MNAPFDSHITFLRTNDLDATDRFYREALGLPLVLDQGKCRIYRICKSSYIGFCTHLTGLNEGDQPSVIITLVADDVDGWYDRLISYTAEVDDDPRLNEEFGIYHFFARDPNGYRVEIQRFENAHWKA